MYQIRCIAYHSENNERMVVYQALYGNYLIYVMPYNIFAEKVDSVQYPDAKQQYCFEQVEFEKSQHIDNQHSHNQYISEDIEKVSEQSEIQLCSKIQSNMEESDTDGVDSRLLMFLDARTYEEKLNVLSYLRNSLDDKLIDVIAVSLDIEVPEGNIDARYMSLRRCIMAHAKYEGARLR
ncbi:MAG: DUF1653 domain-containing protein [Lachnospira sp.]|nr:DUF1653 domain-containing protein [Lachnospira sp.]